MSEQKVKFISTVVDEEEELPILIPLVAIDDDGDCIFTVDEVGSDGVSWQIGYVDAETGKLILCSGLPDNIGLAVGKEGHILTTKE